MWIFTNKGFVSIVEKDCNPGELLVRARRKQDILKIFPDAKVSSTPKADYAFRARISRQKIEKVIADQINGIDYDNFKNSISDNHLHSVCSRVWNAAYSLDERYA